MKRNKKLLIFDYDGTIADTFELHKKAFDLTLGIDLDYENYMGMNTKETIIKIIKDKNLKINDIDMAVEQKRAFVELNISTYLKFLA